MLIHKLYEQIDSRIGRAVRLEMAGRAAAKCWAQHHNYARWRLRDAADSQILSMFFHSFPSFFPICHIKFLIYIYYIYLYNIYIYHPLSSIIIHYHPLSSPWFIGWRWSNQLSNLKPWSFRGRQQARPRWEGPNGSTGAGESSGLSSHNKNGKSLDIHLDIIYIYVYICLYMIIYDYIWLYV